tara:strand:- start:9322 stop:9534 length:213 start_codon:yes stop_codon:yes gene_type:complete
MTEDNKSTEKQCDIHVVSNSYCVKRHMFFSVTDPIMESDLTEKEANELCDKLNKEELDDTYVNYQVHNCC